jgi:chaperonin GroES
MKLEPLNDEILLRQKEQDNMTKGGIFIPKTNQEENAVLGNVLAISEGVLLQDGTIRPHPVKVGDCVLFDKRAATEVMVEGEKLLLIRSLTLLARAVE